MSHLVRNATLYVPLAIVALAFELKTDSALFAATATPTIDVSVPGEFKVFLEVSQGENFGIAGYGLPLAGSFTSLDHLSPQTGFANGPSGGGRAGFTDFRSPDGSRGLGAVQDIVTPTPNLIRGFGQEASSFAAKGLTPLAPPEQPVWDAKLLIAQGTCDGVCNLDFFRTQNLFVNVFSDSTGTAVIDATLNLDPTPRPPVAVDESFPVFVPFPVNYSFLASGTQPISWDNLVLKSGNPASAATLSPGGLFTWNPAGSPSGIYSWDATATNEFGSDIATLTLDLNPSVDQTVTLILDQSVPGEFKVLADVSDGDNFGLAGYAIPLLGAFTTLEHVSPNTLFAQDAVPNGGKAGFTDLRSADGAAIVAATQDLVTPTPHLIREFGQEPGSFAALGLTPLAPAEQPVWDAPLLIAQGTCDGICDLDFDRDSRQMFASVFSSANGAATIDAAIQFVVISVPEPSTTMLVLGSVGFVVGFAARRRK